MPTMQINGPRTPEWRPAREKTSRSTKTTKCPTALQVTGEQLDKAGAAEIYISGLGGRGNPTATCIAAAVNEMTGQRSITNRSTFPMNAVQRPFLRVVRAILSIAYLDSATASPGSGQKHKHVIAKMAWP